MTIEEVKTIIEDEGLSEAIERYVPIDEIDDPILKEKWIHASKLYDEIFKILIDYIR